MGEKMELVEKKFYKKLEVLFLIFMIPIGLAFMFLVLPNYVYEENAHIVRSYDIINGNILPDKNDDNVAIMEVPKQFLVENTSTQVSSYNALFEVLGEKANYDDLIETANTQVDTSFLPHIFASIVFAIAKLFNMNFFIAIYLVRIIHFVIFLLCGYYAIKLIPFGKLLVFVYLFIPTVIYNAISVSADSLINSSIILFIAYSLYLFKTDVSLTRGKKLIYYGLSGFIVLSKFIFFPILFLSLLIFNKKDLDKKNKLIFLGIMFVILIVGGIFHFGVIEQYENSKSNIIFYNVDSDKQLDFMLDNPLSYLEILYNTITQRAYVLLSYFIGSDIGHVTVNINGMIILIYMVLLVVSLYYNYDQEKISLSKYEKILFLVMAILCLFNVLTASYIELNPFQNSVVESIHGKMFVPIIILFLLLFKNNTRTIESRNIIFVFIFLICLVNVNFIEEILKYFLR